jgi:hypothetical protein
LIKPSLKQEQYTHESCSHAQEISHPVVIYDGGLAWVRRQARKQAKAAKKNTCYSPWIRLAGKKVRVVGVDICLN